MFGECLRRFSAHHHLHHSLPRPTMFLRWVWVTHTDLDVTLFTHEGFRGEFWLKRCRSCSSGSKQSVHTKKSLHVCVWLDPLSEGLWFKTRREGCGWSYGNIVMFRSCLQGSNAKLCLGLWLRLKSAEKWEKYKQDFEKWICMYLYMHVYMCIYICVHACINNTYLYTNIHACVYMHIYTHVHICRKYIKNIVIHMYIQM